MFTPGFLTTAGRVLRTTEVFETYWRFAYERQELFYRRLEGKPAPWTNDPILTKYRFTNVYRAADRVSQYLIKRVIYEGDQREEEVIFRVLLFKLFNKIETWELLKEQLGTLAWHSFDISRYDAVLGRAVASRAPIYSSAYIMPSPMLGSLRKHSDHLLLLSFAMKDGLPQKVTSARSLQQLYSRLRSIASIGEFLAFQFAIDLNYSALLGFSEMDFVVAGPGARRGLRKAFVDTGALTDEEVIREVTITADREFRARHLNFRTLWGRPLQLIDCQNIFCEIDKYSRAAFPTMDGHGRTRIKRKFFPSPGAIVHWYPPKWGLRTDQIPRAGEQYQAVA
jgi:hypothetical protein